MNGKGAVISVSQNVPQLCYIAQNHFVVLGNIEQRKENSMNKTIDMKTEEKRLSNLVVVTTKYTAFIFYSVYMFRRLFRFLP